MQKKFFNPTINAPVCQEKIAQMIQDIELPKPSHILDIGCGNGTLTRLAAQKTGTHCVGIDIDKTIIDENQRNSAKNIDFLAIAAKEFPLKNLHYDLVICNGSTHAFGLGPGALERTLTAVKPTLKQHGRLLLGEGFWKTNPCKKYLETFGKKETLHSLEKNSQMIQNAGYRIQDILITSQTIWDTFEKEFLKAAFKEHESLQTEESATKLKQRQIWHQMYQELGRHYLGFVVYLLVPEAR